MSKYIISLKERMLISIEKTLDNFLKIDAFQRYVNRRCSNKCWFKLVKTTENASVDDVFKDYDFNDIQKDDVVLDVGAHVGGFSLFVSKFVNEVYALEPIFVDILFENIKLNNINNISVIPYALGKGKLTIKWSGKKDKEVCGWTLSELKSCIGHIDFLKLDCEGGEWCITPDEIRDIRRIEAEIHNFDGKHDPNDFLNILDEAGFKYEYTNPREGILIIHARNKSF